MPLPHVRKICEARSKRSGKRCRNPAVRGGRTCRMHGGTTWKWRSQRHMELLGPCDPDALRKFHERRPSGRPPKPMSHHSESWNDFRRRWRRGAVELVLKRAQYVASAALLEAESGVELERGESLQTAIVRRIYEGGKEEKGVTSLGLERKHAPLVMERLRKLHQRARNTRTYHLIVNLGLFTLHYTGFPNLSDDWIQMACAMAGRELGGRPSRERRCTKRLGTRYCWNWRVGGTDRCHLHQVSQSNP